MIGRGSRTPAAEPWSIAWRTALAAVGVTDERPTGELIALGALSRFRYEPNAPGSKALRNASVDVPTAARQLAKGLSAFQAAAATTPAAQVERHAALTSLARDLATEFRLDPHGPSGFHLSIVGAPHQLDRAAERAEERIARAELDLLPPAPPRAPAPAFDALIAGLASAYRVTTGRRASAWPSVGDQPPAPFVRFTHTLWPEASDELPPSWRRLRDALRRSCVFADPDEHQSGRMRVPADTGISSAEEIGRCE